MQPLTTQCKTSSVEVGKKLEDDFHYFCWDLPKCLGLFRFDRFDRGVEPRSRKILRKDIQGRRVMMSIHSIHTLDGCTGSVLPGWRGREGLETMTGTRSTHVHGSAILIILAHHVQLSRVSLRWKYDNPVMYKQLGQQQHVIGTPVS